MGTMAYRILVVDDHDDTTRVLSRLLRLKGYDVMTATTVAGALGLCRTIRFDLLVADVDLPDGHGNDVMRALRPFGVKGVAFGGMARPDDIRRAYDAGFAHFVANPALDVLTVVRCMLGAPAPKAGNRPRVAVRRGPGGRISFPTPFNRLASL
jgi:CheY-like chemotaxis protein